MSKTKRVIQKLSMTTGETMVETLVSVLISSLALLMLATAIGSSVKVIMASMSHMEAFYRGQSALVKDAYKDVGESATVSLDVPLNKTDGKSIAVNLYENKVDTSIVLYKKRDAS